MFDCLILLRSGESLFSSNKDNSANFSGKKIESTVKHPGRSILQQYTRKNFQSNLVLEVVLILESKGDVTLDDSQRRFLAQHSIKTLLRHFFEWLQHCSNIATLYALHSR